MCNWAIKNTPVPSHDTSYYSWLMSFPRTMIYLGTIDTDSCLQTSYFGQPEAPFRTVVAGFTLKYVLINGKMFIPVWDEQK